jgi:hypothetical protein
MNSLTRLFTIALVALMIVGVVGCSSIPNVSIPTQPAAQTEMTPDSSASFVVSSGTQTQSESPSTDDAKGKPIVNLLKREGLVAGTVRNHTGDTFTLKSRGKDGERFQTDSNTIFVVPGKLSATASDIKVGDLVIASVPPKEKKSVAKMVMVLPENFSLDSIVIGAVQSNNAGTLSVRTPRETVQLKVGDTATIVDLEKGTAKLIKSSDLKQGNAVAIIRDSNGQAAQTVLVLQEKLRDLIGKNDKSPKK